MRILPKTISEQEFLEGLKKVKRQKLKLAFMLGFYQAMRVSEIVNLKPEDVDMDRGFIHILQAKGKKDRDVPIMKPVKHGLRHLPIGLGVRSLEKWVKRYWPDIHYHTLRHCVSEDTEVLTIDGWKKYTEVKENDNIFSYNLKKDLIELDNIEKVNTYDYNGELYNITNKYIDCLATEDHKCLFKIAHYKPLGTGKKNVTQWRDDWELISIKDFLSIKNKRLVKHRLSSFSDGKLSIGKVRAGILGWIISDGTIKKRCKKFEVGISQSWSANKKKCKMILNLLENSGLEFSAHLHTPTINNFSGAEYQMMAFRIFNKDVDWIFEWLNTDKTPKYKLLQLKKEELEEVFKCIMLGDGSRQEYTVQNRKFIEFFQTLCYFINKKVFIGYGEIYPHGKKKYRTYAFNRNEVNIWDKNIKKVDYKGIVWCPTTRNKTFIAKRNDKIFITGNSGATFYLNDKNVDIRHIQLLLGHSQLNTTQIYTHVSPKNLKDKFDGVW